MMTDACKQADTRSNEAVIQWLLECDPAIHRQVMNGLTHEPAEVVAADLRLSAANFRSDTNQGGMQDQLLDG